jgi:hypothetical protein
MDYSDNPTKGKTMTESVIEMLEDGSELPTKHKLASLLAATAVAFVAKDLTVKAYKAAFHAIQNRKS